MNYEELYNTIRRKLYEVCEVSETLNVNKFISFIEIEEAKLYNESICKNNDELPF